MQTVQNSEKIKISVITKDATQSFILFLRQYKTKVNVMDVIPKTIESFGVTPDTIVIDSM